MTFVMLGARIGTQSDEDAWKVENRKIAVAEEFVGREAKPVGNIAGRREG